MSEPLSQEMVDKIKRATEDKIKALESMQSAERDREINRLKEQHADLVKRVKAREEGR